jgi:hypothetical protein
MPLDIRELSCVLAALRYWQWQRQRQTNTAGRRRLTDIHSIEDNDGEILPLSDREIDGLCERLNCGELR